MVFGVLLDTLAGVMAGVIIGIVSGIGIIVLAKENINVLTAVLTVEIGMPAPLENLLKFC